MPRTAKGKLQATGALSLFFVLKSRIYDYAYEQAILSGPTVGILKSRKGKGKQQVSTDNCWKDRPSLYSPSTDLLDRNILPKLKVLSIGSDGMITVTLQRNRRNNLLTPTPQEIEIDLTLSLEPIKIDIWEYVLDKKVDVQRVELVQYMDVLLKFVHRWKHLRLWAPWVAPECLYGRVIYTSPLLESVELGAHPGFDIPRVAQLLSCCWLKFPDYQSEGSISPLLRYKITERSENSILTANTMAEYVPLFNLTCLHLENQLSASDCLAILTHTTNLVDCAFTNILGPNASHGAYVEVHCLQLHSLKLANNFDDHVASRPHDMHMLFQKLSAPSLRELTVEDDDNFRMDALLDFMTRSRCVLEALELHMLQVDSEGLYSLLLLVPHLRVLKIFGDDDFCPQGFSSDLCEVMTNRRRMDVDPQAQGIDWGFVCPELEMFAINAPAIAELQDGKISAMIESRVNLTPLRVVWIQADEHGDSAVQTGQQPEPIFEKDRSIFQEIRANAFRWRRLKKLTIACDVENPKKEEHERLLNEWRNDVLDTLHSDWDYDDDDGPPTPVPVDAIAQSAADNNLAPHWFDNGVPYRQVDGPELQFQIARPSEWMEVDYSPSLQASARLENDLMFPQEMGNMNNAGHGASRVNLDYGNMHLDQQFLEVPYF